MGDDTSFGGGRKGQCSLRLPGKSSPGRSLAGLPPFIPDSLLRCLAFKLHLPLTIARLIQLLPKLGLLHPLLRPGRRRQPLDLGRRPRTSLQQSQQSQPFGPLLPDPSIDGAEPCRRPYLTPSSQRQVSLPWSLSRRTQSWFSAQRGYSNHLNHRIPLPNRLIFLLRPPAEQAATTNPALVLYLPLFCLQNWLSTDCNKTLNRFFQPALFLPKTSSHPTNFTNHNSTHFFQTTLLPPSLLPPTATTTACSPTFLTPTHFFEPTLFSCSHKPPPTLTPLFHRVLASHKLASTLAASETAHPSTSSGPPSFSLSHFLPPTSSHTSTHLPPTSSQLASLNTANHHFFQPRLLSSRTLLPTNFLARPPTSFLQPYQPQHRVPTHFFQPTLFPSSQLPGRNCKTLPTSSNARSSSSITFFPHDLYHRSATNLNPHLPHTLFLFSAQTSHPASLNYKPNSTNSLR